MAETAVAIRALELEREAKEEAGCLQRTYAYGRSEGRKEGS